MNNTYLRAQQLRKKDAQFPFVKIGTQYWTLKNHDLSVTPQGTAIQEMQSNGNIEKITNSADRDFSSDTGFWHLNHGATISNGTLNILNATAWTGGIQVINLKSVYYKVSLTITNYISGEPGLYYGGSNSIPAANGTYTFYIKPTSELIIRFVPFSDSSNYSIDNISIQEIGWSGSQELYDGIYAQTSGTVEQKTYAAVKAAAMWCHYNNDVAIGAVHGKLYNWFAVKLLQMDIDYYNAAHPTTPYGWRVPTQTEFQTLSTYLGGDAVSGGHLKEAGLAHWNSPNIGADNSSGFTALGSGLRSINGEFSSKGISELFYTITMSGINGYYLILNNDTSVGTTWRDPFIQGFCIRLIKA